MRSQPGGNARKTSGRAAVHAVDMTGAALGLFALVFMPFVTFRGSRIQTGEGLSVLDAIGPAWTALIAAVWVALVVLSRRSDRRRVPSAARGVLASVALVGTLGLTAVAAARLADPAQPFARVSVGIGAWAAVIAGYMVILASRRELGSWSRAGAVVSVLAPAGVLALLLSGALSDLGILREYASRSDRFWSEVAAHAAFSAVSMAVAIVAGVGLGVLAFRHARVKQPVFAVVSVFQTIPGLAMVGLLFAPLSWLGSNVDLFRRLGVGGLGWAPVITALTLYALLAVVRNTYAGLEGVPAAAVDAARGVGMTEGQIMRRVRFPLAVPAVLGGVRTATVQTVGNATLGAFVAAGTLGLFVFGGLSQQATDLIMLASIAIVALALLADGALRVVQRVLQPRHVASEGSCE